MVAILTRAARPTATVLPTAVPLMEAVPLTAMLPMATVPLMIPVVFLQAAAPLTAVSLLFRSLEELE